MADVYVNDKYVSSESEKNKSKFQNVLKLLNINETVSSKTNSNFLKIFKLSIFDLLRNVIIFVSCLIVFD